MTTNSSLWLAAVVSAAAVGCSAPSAVSVSAAPGAKKGMPAVAGPFQSITVMTFGPDGTLFVGDSGSGKIHALKPPTATNAQAKASYNLKRIDSKIAGLLGTTASGVRVRDLAVHPQTKEAYLAVARATGERYVSAIVVLNQAGEVRLLDQNLSVAELKLPATPASDFKIYDFASRDLSLTDLEYHDGKLYIAGLSNADFASTLWVASVPFSGSAATATVEIYHAIHNQRETRAPIRTMAIMNLGGVDHLVAAYTCTPLVVIPLSEIKDGAKITGKTIGELGYGNTPGDLLTFSVQDSQQNTSSVLFISNKNQQAQVIGLQALEEAAKSEGLTKPVMMQKRDLQASDVPMTSIVQIDNQDEAQLSVLRRDVDEGDLELVSYLKNVYFRLSDFQSEYEVPGYEYPKDQEPMRQFHNMMKAKEGFPELVR